jgi:MerR family transcriptional regulator, light-induced transcriptional regulator
MDDRITTAEAARLAGVGTTSVKRWADQGLLEVYRTPGGHRRFSREALRRLLGSEATSRVPPEGGSVPPEGATGMAIGAPSDGAADVSAWLATLLSWETRAIEAALVDARGRLGAWHAVADALVGPALVEMGARWREGQVSIADEHMASEHLGRALARIGESIPVGPRSPRCLLACAEGDDHTLGLSLADVCLREAGWRALWVGRRTPTDTVVEMVRTGAVRRVALSASAASTDVAHLASQVQRVHRICEAVGADLVLGGSGAWPEVPGVTRLHSFDAFHHFLVEGYASPR